jgi:hypothetical protein
LKKGTSKNKGSSWEREIGRELSKWWSNNTNKNIFVRSINSGGWGTMHRSEGVTAHSGDIESVDGVGKPFTNKIMVEAKWYKEENSVLFEVLLNQRSQVLEWWAKCEKEATDVFKVPMLVVKFNYRVPFIVIPNYFYSEVYKVFGEPNTKASIILQLDFDDTIYKCLMVMRFDNFLDWCKPSFFHIKEEK